MHHKFLTLGSRLAIAAVVLPSTALAGLPEKPASSAALSEAESGWSLSLEGLALRSYVTQPTDDSRGFDAAYRGSAAYQFSDGLFAKIAYFGYSGDLYDVNGISSNPNDTYQNSEDLDASYLDLIVGQHYNPSTSLTFSPFMGLRWATFEESYKSSGTSMFGASPNKYSVHGSSDFSGLGIVVGIDAVRAIGNNVSLYSVAKQSVVFGTRDSTGFSSFSGQSSRSDDRAVAITELSLGMQYDCAFSGIDAQLRAGVEGQYWNDAGNTGLAGFVLGADFAF